MDTPLIISGAGHLGLVAVLLFGGLFPDRSEPTFDSAEVTVMSEEEFAALTRPETGEAEPPPMLPSTEPSAAVDEDAPPDQPPPQTPRVADPAPVPEPDPAPQPEPDQTPAPQPDPAPEPDPEPAPPAAPDLPRAERETPAPAPRVAPTPAPTPPAPAETAPDTREAVAPDPAAEAPELVEEEPAAAPEAAAPEIVTEAEDPATRAAPDATGRPRSRPVRRTAAAPDPQPDPQPQADPDPAPRTEGETRSASSDALRDAVRDTIAGLEERVETGDLEGAPVGPPLTQGEQDGFKLAVQRCWNVDVGSEAADVTISVRFAMNPDNTVVSGSLRQVSASGGSAAAQRTAFEWARRAILRCQVEGGGYDLPVEKYAQWQQVVVTFNPRDMRVR